MKQQNSQSQSHPLTGRMAGIRTTTMYYTGRVESIDAQFVVLREATWILETGPWADFAKDLGGEEYAEYPPDAPVYVFCSQCVEIFPADESVVQAKRLSRRLHVKTK